MRKPFPNSRTRSARIRQQYRLSCQCLLFFLLLLFSSRLSAQTRTLIGKVTDEKGQVLAGASVSVTGSRQTVTTGSDGAYSIHVPEGNGTLTISFVGYKQKVISFSGTQSSADISLGSVATDDLNQVVVTGYSRQSKRDITGAISTISSDVIAQTPVTDVGSVLQGRVSGVSVDNQGGPGSSAVVRIRGFGTNGNNDPLYVIDGVQVRLGSDANGGSGSVDVSALVNPGDIETITILKDPSITSLYGAQGGNGVIVITTKSGKQGTPRLEYSTYASWEKSIKLPKLLTPQGYAHAYWSYLDNSGLPQNDLYYGSGSQAVLPDYIVERNAGAALAVKAGDPAADPSLYNLSSYRILKTNKAGTDWAKEVLGTAFSQNHQLSVSGATDKSNYALSMNYFDNKGVLAGTYFRRYSLRVNTEFRPAKWFKIGENMAFSFSQGNTVTGSGNHNPNNIFSDLYNRSPLIPVYDIDGNFSGPKGIPDSKSFHPGGNNPLFGQKEVEANNHGYNAGLIGSAYADVEPIKGLVFETKIGLQFYPYSYRFFSDSFPQNVYSPPYNSFSEGGGWSTDWRWTNKISYDFRIGDIHKISAFAAIEARQFVSRNNGGTTPRLPFTSASYLNLSNGVPVDTTGGVFNSVSGGSDEATAQSVFGNINYSLLDRYLFSFVIRPAGSRN